MIVVGEPGGRTVLVGSMFKGILIQPDSMEMANKQTMSFNEVL
jgi:hypothetical protein